MPNRSISFLLLLFFVCNPDYIKAQISPLYNPHTAKADSFYQQKQYSNALLWYENAFNLNNNLGKIIHRYQAAACYTQLNLIDSAFYQLNKIAPKFSKYDLIANDTLFIKLHADPRWSSLLGVIQQNSQIKSSGIIIKDKNQ